MRTNDQTGSFPNAEQRRVIDNIDGRMLVLAPAGTGKTQVMAERVAQAIDSGHDPERMLGITFTNRAAQEMRERIQTRAGNVAGRVMLKTFHGLCCTMIRSEAAALGIFRDFVICDEEDCAEILKALGHRSDAKDIFFRISAIKSSAPADLLSLNGVQDCMDEMNVEPELRSILPLYQAKLREQHALDFADLVYWARCLMHLLPENASTWKHRFNWIQLDEVQDTHASEYDILCQIADGSGSITLYGDVDQTIYGWRGSDPLRIIRQFKSDFDPVTEHSLNLNYRATCKLLDVANRFAATFPKRFTQLTPSPQLPPGTPPVVVSGNDPQDEARQLVPLIRKEVDAGRKTGILVRTHKRAESISEVLKAAQIPHVTVEQYEFFRRMEVKDALARLRVVLNPFDMAAAQRLLERPACGIGPVTIDKIHTDGSVCGLRLTDMLNEVAIQHGDVFGQLLEAWQSGTIVVLDVETTGLTEATDEVIEIAALRIEHGEKGSCFHRYILPTRDLGDSAQIHGITRDFLEKHGEAAADVFRDLASFLSSTHVVGHNVGYDLAMIRHHASRCGITIPAQGYDDTMEIARRFVKSERFDLATLCERMDIATRPTHRAEDDAEATLGLLQRLMPLLTKDHAKRQKLFANHGSLFLSQSKKLSAWREAAQRTRPPVLLMTILEESGLNAFYRDDARRKDNLDQLKALLLRQDRPDMPPLVALQAATQLASLARNVDHIDKTDPRIPVITVHAAKGLEFDTVFLAGLCAHEFPTNQAARSGDLGEERRLFYVGLTRPKLNLVVSYSMVNIYGRTDTPSVFLKELKLAR